MEKVAIKAMTGWRFGMLCAAQIWLAHTIAFFSHEYAHSFTAWLLGFKMNPWLLHFGTLSFSNVIAMMQVNENVDYDLIYAQGHNYLAALIGFAGFGIGNVLLYVLCRVILAARKISLTPMWRLFFFWLCLMNVGNFYDYIPIRTIDPQGDIAHIVTGLACSPWTVLIVLGIPTTWTLWHLFWRLLPQAMAQSFPGQPRRQEVLRAVSIYLVFVFFAGVGLFSQSHVSKVLAGLSFLFALLVLAYLRYGRRQPEARLSERS
ncbi:MAG TPA: hypothetical protein VGV14_08480 [Rhodanobacter sp.]|nr:hypothetical protein [Rhodanobacter sp.]